MLNIFLKFIFVVRLLFGMIVLSFDMVFKFLIICGYGSIWFFMLNFLLGCLMVFVWIIVILFCCFWVRLLLMLVDEWIWIFMLWLNFLLEVRRWIWSLLGSWVLIVLLGRFIMVILLRILWIFFGDLVLGSLWVLWMLYVLYY